MTATALGIAAAVWGIVMALAPVLQIRRIVRHRSSDDVSIAYLAVLAVGFSLWIVYGIALRSLVLVLPNTLALLMGMTTIGFTLRYRSPG